MSPHPPRAPRRTALRRPLVSAPRAVALVLWPVLLLSAVGAEQLAAQDFRFERKDAVRVGMFHPQPRFCTGAEPAQRDLRMLRLAFSVNRDPASRMQLPWYLRAVPESNGEQAEALFSLRTMPLWDFPREWLGGADDPAGAPAAGGPLAPWRASLVRLLAVARGLGGPAASPGGGTGRSPEGWDPFLPTRLHAAAALPFIAGAVSSDAGAECPTWPAGVWLQKREGNASYTLTMSRTDRGAPFVLTGYRREAALWQDLRRGRLDHVLLEGTDVTTAKANLPPRGRVVWAKAVGSQQIVLEWSPHLREALRAEGALALSLAVPRVDLARLYGPGRLEPASGYLTPILTQPAEDSRERLKWDPRQSRRIWLRAAPAVPRVRLATLDHPALQAMAQRIGEQWQRTLNLTVTAVSLPVDAYHAAREVWSHDIFLTVADLEDGSLQNLWLNALEPPATDGDETAGDVPPDDARLLEWEAQLARAWPYLPVLEKVHYAVALGEAGAASIRALCPACAVGVKAPAGDAPPPPRRRAVPVVPPEG